MYFSCPRDVFFLTSFDILDTVKATTGGRRLRRRPTVVAVRVFKMSKDVKKMSLGRLKYIFLTFYGPRGHFKDICLTCSGALGHLFGHFWGHTPKSTQRLFFLTF